MWRDSTAQKGSDQARFDRDFTPQGCGHILNAHVFKDNMGRGKGYGLVCFEAPEVSSL